jgi:hypothetical protein
VALCGINPHRIKLYAGTLCNKSNQQANMSSQAFNPEHKKYWLAGFIEGEGSFNVAFKLHPDSKLGFYPSPTFSLTQHLSLFGVVVGHSPAHNTK